MIAETILGVIAVIFAYAAWLAYKHTEDDKVLKARQRKYPEKKP